MKESLTLFPKEYIITNIQLNVEKCFLTSQSVLFVLNEQKLDIWKYF